MSKQINVTLTIPYFEFLKEMVSGGLHASRSEAIRMALMHYRELLVKRRGSNGFDL